MKLPRTNSFVSGFTVALILLSLFLACTSFRWVGGKSVASPNGAFRARVANDFDISRRRRCVVTLERIADQVTLRRLVIEDTHPPTVPMRDVTIAWDSTNSFVDISTGSDQVVRVWVPKDRIR